MKRKMNLSAAFVLRKRVNDIAADFADRTRFLQFVMEPELIAETNETFKGGSFEAELALYKAAHKTSADLTAVIEEKNADGKRILSRISHINTMIGQYQRFKAALANKTTIKERNPITGVYEIHSLAKLTDYDFAAEIQRLEREKHSLEDALSNYNSMTDVEVDIPDELYTEIYG